jgi:vacuolar-type H+-ATPase subunit I/STV1
MSLHPSWQPQRQRLTNQQRYVRQTLDRFQQIRQAHAIALPDLQPVQTQIQPDSRTYLEQASTQRRIQISHLMQQLADFIQRLRQQTAELLSLQSADRAILAEQLSQELSDFHTHLTAAVAALRHRVQQQVQQMRAETQETLQTAQQSRIQQQIQLMQDLTNYAAVLQVEVKNQLIDLSLIRRARSQQVPQQLQSSHDRRLNDMATLRADLQSFCAEMRQIVGAVNPEPIAAPAEDQPD